ncbi:MAG TPA: hypothetical protein VIK78_05410 [Ruminiclostridium sp.]
MNILGLTEREKTAIVSLLVTEIYNAQYLENSKGTSLELERIIEKLEKSS